MKSILLLVGIIVIFNAQAQETKAKSDSVSYMKTLIQSYNKAVNHDSSAYNPYLHASAFNDSMFTKAMAWRKWAVDYPVILNYLHMPDTSNEQTKRIIARLDSNESERNSLLKKAVAFFQKNGYPNVKQGADATTNKPKSTPKTGKGGVINHDATIKDSILKTWKF